jgi:hypothetical protein
MNNTTVDFRSDDVLFHFHHFDISTLTINHQMSASNDELLFNAARDGDVSEVKELLSKGVGTGCRDKVSYLIIMKANVYCCFILHIDNSVVDDYDDDAYVC